MLEHKQTSRRSVIFDQQAKGGGSEWSSNEQLKPPKTPPRPGMGDRGFTESVRGMESPRILADEKTSPFDKVSLTDHDFATRAD